MRANAPGDAVADKGKKETALSRRAHVFYSGRVQGVGFRYTAEGAAHKAGLRGFVRNLQDGRVEVVCEGAQEKIDLFLAEIQEGPMGRHIQKTDCRWEEPTGSFTDFTVEFHF